MSDDLFDELDQYLNEATKASRLREEHNTLQHKLRSKGRQMSRQSIERAKEDLSRLAGEIEQARWQVTGVAIFWRRTTCTSCGCSHQQFEAFGQRQVTYTKPHTYRTVRFYPEVVPAAIQEQVFHDHQVPCCINCYPMSDDLPKTIVKESY